MTPLFPAQPHAILVATELDNFFRQISEQDWVSANIKCRQDFRVLVFRILNTLYKNSAHLETPQSSAPIKILYDKIIPRLKAIRPEDKEVVNKHILRVLPGILKDGENIRLCNKEKTINVLSKMPKTDLIRLGIEMMLDSKDHKI